MKPLPFLAQHMHSHDICFSGATLPPDLGDFYGSDGAVFQDDSSRRHQQVSCPPTPAFLRMSSTPTISPWKMNKAELVETLVQPDGHHCSQGMDCSGSIISEQKEDPHHNELMGLSSMKLDQLITKARKAGIEIPTRGLLMRLIRDNVPATPEELVPFGRYKGYRYCEVPSSYLDWAITETGDNSSPDLIRLAHWAKENKSKKVDAISKNKPQGY